MWRNMFAAYTTLHKTSKPIDNEAMTHTIGDFMFLVKDLPNWLTNTTQKTGNSLSIKGYEHDPIYVTLLFYERKN